MLKCIRNYLTFIFLAFLSIDTSFSQASIRASYHHQYDLKNQSLGLYPLEGFGLAVGYTFKPINIRIVFLPELVYNELSSLKQRESSEYALKSKQTGMIFNFSFYPMDLQGDCNCPTFNKQGNLIKKGFYIQVNPSVYLFKGEVKQSFVQNTIELPFNDNLSKLVFGIGAGAGLDIGINNHFTITPIINYTYLANSYKLVKEEEENLTIGQLDIGIKTTFYISDNYKRNLKRRNKRL